MAVATAAEAVALKSQGNEHLKAGRHAEATDCYTAALTTCDPADAAALHCNRALAELKLGKHTQCIEDCDAAIQKQPQYGKAFFRRAQAKEALDKLPEAFKDIHELMRIEPGNKEAQAMAVKLKRGMEMKAQLGDLSTPTLAVEKLLNPKSSDQDRLQAVGKLSRCAEDKSRAPELLHAGCVAPILALLPSADDVSDAASLQMPLVGLCVEVLERMAQSDDVAVLRAIAATDAAGSSGGGKLGATGAKLVAIAKAAATAKPPAAVEGEAAAAAAVEEDGAAIVDITPAEGAPAAAASSSDDAAQSAKNLFITCGKCVSLVASLAGCRGAVGDQAKQGALLLAVLPFAKEGPDDKLRMSGLDAVLRVADRDAEACRGVLPQLVAALAWQLGDEESSRHRVALATMHKLLMPRPSEHDPKSEDEDHNKGVYAACEAALSKTLRNSASSWEEHVAAVHGVTAVLEVNKTVGAWLLRQESIFWALAEVAEMEDDELTQSLAEIYAHAANDVQHFREKAGDEPIKHLRGMLKSTQPKIRARACVALAKVCLLHHDHRVAINPTGKLLQATLGLLEAKVAPSVHRWAVESLMYLTIMPDVKRHLVENKLSFGSLTSLADSVSKEEGKSTLHYSLVSALRQMCCPKEKTDEQKRLEQEMDEKQIEQMRQMANPGSQTVTEKMDDPEVMNALAAQLAADDATLVVSELVAGAPDGAKGVMDSAARVMLAMSTAPDVRGKMVQQGGFKALLSLVLSEERSTRISAAWALARIAISINPALYPRRTGSGPEGMVKPMLQLVDEADNELQQFEACMGLCNLATVPELRARMVQCHGWRSLQMALTCDNPMVQRAAIEAMSNMVAEDEIVERFLDPDSQDVKIFIGFCGSDDEKAQIAASGALATLAEIPECATAILKAKGGIDAFVELAIVATEPALLHRAAVCLKHLVSNCMDLMVGAKGSEAPPPDHALPALGALTVLSKSSIAPVKQAALTAIVELQKRRPDVALPHPDLIQKVVDGMKEEAARKEAERLAEEAEAEAEEAARREAGAELPGVEEGDEDADVDEDLGEVV